MEKIKMTEVFRVVKTESGKQIRAYKKFDGEIGAEMDKYDYIMALAEEMGNPLMILTKSQLLEKLMKSADLVQKKMQQSTVLVAGLKVPVSIE